MSELVKWLSGLPRTTNVKEVTLTVKDETFVGAVYDQTLEYQTGMDAVSRGDKKAGDKYTETRYLFLGAIPKCRQKRKALCFTHEGRTLYLSSYYEKNDKNEYHPFGKCFQLGIWPETHGPIDQYERYPYHRVPVELV